MTTRWLRSATVVVALGLIVVGCQKEEPKYNRLRSQANLQQIGIALHMYHDDTGSGRLPSAAICSEDGTLLLSWRVAILPYLEQEELYKRFKLDEPWDSEHNKKLIPSMPRVYAHPAAHPAPGMTYYQVFEGPGAIFDGTKKAKLGTIANCDGLANTLMVVEAAEPVPWTKPADLPFDPNKPLPKLGGQFGSGFNVLFADRSVRFLKQDIDATLLRALITTDGREDVKIPD